MVPYAAPQALFAAFCRKLVLQFRNSGCCVPPEKLAVAPTPALAGPQVAFDSSPSVPPCWLICSREYKKDLGGSAVTLTWTQERGR